VTEGGVLARLDRVWTRLEVALCAFAGGTLIITLCLWVLLKLFAAHSAYFANLMAWLQDGTALTLVGGLRGLGTRLTLWLALLGGSLATASGRQVTVDLVTRGLGEKAQKPISLAMGLVAALVCISSAWGFLDFIAIDAFGAKSGESRLAAVVHGAGDELFVLRRQMALDLRMTPRVLGGSQWDQSLTGAEWNAWLDSGDWPSHVGADRAASMRESDAASTHVPLASLPGEPSRGLLLKTLNLIVPFGLLMIGLRFLLWVLRRGPVEAAHGAPP
jgi:TRAP-type C4-dicarboxylate transport system permease small subunit